MSTSLDSLPGEKLIAKALPPIKKKKSILEDGICTLNQLHSELPLGAKGQFTFQKLTQANNHGLSSHWVG